MDTYSYANFSSNTEKLIAARSNRVKNKAPAEIQITAEQLLREASERPDIPFRKRALDAEAMQESPDQLHVKRKSFEDALRRNRNSIGTWLKYAAWEEKLEDRSRARSIYERALEVEYRNPVIWLKYAEMEMKAGNIQHTRNIWNRAVSLLPRVDQFWYKWAYFEEKLGNLDGARAIFERWIEGWSPPSTAFHSFIKLEMRYKEIERARAIYAQMVAKFPSDAEVWVEAAKWEESMGSVDQARSLYKKAISTLAVPKLFTNFAKFEIRRQNYDQARKIFIEALFTLPEHVAEPLFLRYTQFEKQYGTTEEAERVVLEGRVRQYELELKVNPHSYDTWFQRIWLEEELAKMPRLLQDDKHANESTATSPPYLKVHDQSSIKGLYERSIQNVPLSLEKQYWRRYIYLWICYAVWMEVECLSRSEAISILERAINIIPAETGWTFSKLWLLLAKALIRDNNLGRARRILGMAIGKDPRRSLFIGYISLEMKLKEFDRVRILYEKWLFHQPNTIEAWVNWANMEAALGDYERAKGILNIAISELEQLDESIVRMALEYAQEKQEKISLLNKWISILPQAGAGGTEPWLLLCKLDPSQWERAISYFGEDYEKASQIFDLVIEEERANGRSTDHLEAKRPIFDATTNSWKPPVSVAEDFDDGECNSVQSLQETSAALRLLDLAQKWRKGETLNQNENSEEEENLDY